MAAKYKITIKTGDRYGAGTDATVSIIIIGTDGQTKAKALDKWFHNDFEAGQRDEYTVKEQDVGSLLMIKLFNDGGGFFKKSSDWFVNSVIIRKVLPDSPEKVYQFPCFRWVSSELVVFEGKALLAIDEQHAILQQGRTQEIQQCQEMYKWGDDPDYTVDLPGFIKAKDPQSLPKDVQFTDEATGTLHHAKRKALLNLGLGHFFGLFDKWDHFNDYRKCFTPLVGDVPPAADHWQDDVWYGTQFLNGCNPDTIQRCTALPPHFPVTDDMVKGLLDNGITLNQAMEAGRLYMVDYKILEDIPHFGEKDPEVERRHTSASMGLFYVRDSGKLVPIAIQLHQQPSQTNPIWTPKDSEYDWLFAKLWLRNADTQWHQMITHLMRCHLMMEPLAVASWRQLPSLHPVWKILFPHIKGVMAINTLGRGRLIAKGGVSDQTLSIGGGGHVMLMQKYYRSLTIDTYDLPKMLEKRGVNEAEKLPHFYYRDDAMKLWNTIRQFVDDILGIYYPSDDAVAQDAELQNWARDIHDNGYPSRSANSVDKGLPASYQSREGLAHFLTIAIFTSSCQHAAVNFSQMDTYGFHPNSPSLMRQPPPVKKGHVGIQHIMDCLATKHQSCIVIATVYDLTRLYPTEKFLGDYSEGLFTDETALRAISRFQENLKKISAEITERNKGLDIPYTYLLPERIPNSIAI